MRVSVPGMNVRSSNVAQVRGRSDPNPRMRYRASSALIWMSSITAGVNVPEVPRGEGSPPIKRQPSRPRIEAAVGGRLVAYQIGRSNGVILSSRLG